MDHDELVEEAKQAINKVFGDTSVSRSKTKESLNDIAGRGFGSLKCDYTGTPPFADAEWKDDPTMCQWCAGTGHPYGDESYGMCECPALRPNKALSESAREERKDDYEN